MAGGRGPKLEQVPRKMGAAAPAAGMPMAAQATAAVAHGQASAAKLKKKKKKVLQRSQLLAKPIRASKRAPSPLFASTFNDHLN